MLACGLGSGAEVPHGLRRGQLSSQCGLWCSCPRSPVSGCATLGRKSASASLGLQPMSGDDRASPPPSRGHGLTVKGGQCPALPCVFSLCDLKTANTDVLTRTQRMRWSPDPGPLPHPGHEAWCLWQPSPLCGSCLCPPHCPQQPSIFGCSHAFKEAPGVLLRSLQGECLLLSSLYSFLVSLQVYLCLFPTWLFNRQEGSLGPIQP